MAFLFLVNGFLYDDGIIPGVGKYMANVNQSRNLIIQADDDMAVPHKGIELDFRRPYNSLSTHDYFATDGGQISNYGGGWTNTFDAHLALTSSGGLAVYDVDGAEGLYKIFGRNSNTYLQFSYSFDNGNSSSSCLLNQVNVLEEIVHGPGGRGADSHFAVFRNNPSCWVILQNGAK